MATAMKMTTATAITIYLRLIRTRMYSRSIDSCEGNALYSAELIGLRNSAGSPGCSSRNPSLPRGKSPRGSLFRGSLLRGTRGPDDIVTPYSLSPPQARCNCESFATHRFSLQPDLHSQQAGQTRAGCSEEFA